MSALACTDSQTRLEDLFRQGQLMQDECAWVKDHGQRCISMLKEFKSCRKILALMAVTKGDE